MRHECLSFIFIGLVFFALTGSNYHSQTDVTMSDLKLSIRSDKETYIRGEIVNVTVRLENRGMSRVRGGTGPVGINHGSTFYVSRGGSDYVKYENPYWQQQGASRSILLEPNGIFEDTSDLVWNLKPETAHLSPMWVEISRRGRILTDYVFQTAGTYRIKAVFWNITGLDGRGYPESEPIEIRIVEPRGEDLTVWRLIENRPDIAYFVQNTEIQNANSDAERVTRSRELREIAQRYPNSIIARQIGQKLEEYRARLGRAPWEPRPN